MASDAVRRAPLLERLDDAAMITTLVAGSGFGKTTVLAQWAITRRALGLWIDGATVADDPAAFWRRVFSLARETGIVSEGARQRDTEADLSDPSGRAAAVSDFASRVPDPFVLIVDNGQVLDMTEIGRDLVLFARFAHGSRVLVADRRRRFRPTMFAADVEETHLAATELLLSPDETLGLLSARSRRPSMRTPPEDVHELAAGVVGLVRRMLSSPSDVTQSAGIVDDLVMPWALAASDGEGGGGAASGTPPEAPLAPLLIAAMGAADLHEASAQSGLDPARARAVLDAAVERGLGWWEEGPSGRFLFAPVIALSTRAILSARLAPEEKRRIAATAAQIHADRGDAATAFRLALDAEDFDLAVAIGKTSFLELSGGDPAGLLARLKRIPLTRLRKQPLIVLLIAILHLQSPRGLAAGAFHFRLAEQFARATESTSAPDDRALMVGVRSAALRMQGKFDKAVPVAREFIERFDALTPEQQDRLSSVSKHALFQVAHALFFSGDTDAAIGAAQRMLAVPVPTWVEEDRSIHTALGMIAAIEATKGSMVAAEQTLAEASAHPPRRSAWHETLPRVAEAYSLIERGRFREARDAVNDYGYDMAAEEYWPFHLTVQVMAELGDGGTEAAIRLLESRLTTTSTSRQARATRDSVIALHAILCLAARPRGTATEILKHVTDRGPVRLAVEALIALREGRSIAALQLAGDALVAKANPPRLRAVALLVRAAASVTSSLEAGRRASSDALALMVDEGLTTPWLVLTREERAIVMGLGAAELTEELRAALDAVPVLFDETSRSVHRLTPREKEVLTLLLSGSSIPDVAAALNVSPNTVKTQRSRVYQKLGVNNRADAQRVAVEFDLL